jgi:hypothetical protein
MLRLSFYGGDSYADVPTGKGYARHLEPPDQA